MCLSLALLGITVAGPQDYEAHSKVPRFSTEGCSTSRPQDGKP